MATPSRPVRPLSDVPPVLGRDPAAVKRWCGDNRRSHGATQSWGNQLDRQPPTFVLFMQLHQGTETDPGNSPAPEGPSGGSNWRGLIAVVGEPGGAEVYCPRPCKLRSRWL